MVTFRRYSVVVEVATPREDWLSRLTEPPTGCVECGGPLPDPPIIVSTEGVELVGTDLLCSWGCVLRLSASVVATTDEPSHPSVSVIEVDDWRGRTSR